MTTDPDKMMDDLTNLILGRVYTSYGEGMLDPFEDRWLRNEIRDLIAKHMDISEAAFDAAFEGGREAGREAGFQEARGKLRKFADNF